MSFRIGEKVIVIGESLQHDFPINSIVTVVDYDKNDDCYDCEMIYKDFDFPHKQWIHSSAIAAIPKPNHSSINP